MINQDLNRHFAQLCGLCWYEPDCDCGICAFCNGQAKNPNFVADPRLVLKEMKTKSDFQLFLDGLAIGESDLSEMVPVDYILDATGLLVKAAIEWIEKEDGQ